MKEPTLPQRIVMSTFAEAIALVSAIVIGVGGFFWVGNISTSANMAFTLTMITTALALQMGFFGKYLIYIILHKVFFPNSQE